MFKCLALLSVIVLCKADDYYQMSIDHKPDGQYKTITEHKQYTEEAGYESPTKKDKLDRSGYGLPQGYGYLEKSVDDGSGYSAPYGYERSLYERQSYERPAYSQSYGKNYDQDTYVEQTYSPQISAIRNVEIRPIQSSGGYEQKDHLIDVKDETPIVIHFRTHANRIKVEQTRVPDKPKEVEHTRSEDEPHRVVHEVYKPVIQEIREIIQPFRKVVQQVQPVVEEVQTVIHKAEGRRVNGAGDGGSGRGEYGERQAYGGGGGGGGYDKRPRGPSNKKYSTLKDYLPQGSVLSAKGVPVYRSQYKGPAIPQKKH
jgi:hypothetical protein